MFSGSLASLQSGMLTVACLRCRWPPACVQVTKEELPLFLQDARLNDLAARML